MNQRKTKNLTCFLLNSSVNTFKRNNVLHKLMWQQSTFYIDLNHVASLIVATYILMYVRREEVFPILCWCYKKCCEAFRCYLF